MNEGDIRIELLQQQDYRFTVHFGDPSMAPLTTDEPPPLGGNAGPNPARLLGAAVGNCMSASLLFALRKYGNEPGPLRTEVAVTVERNTRGRMRIPRIAVDLHLGVPANALKHAGRAVGQFEDFCVVTQSVRAGIDVQARVWDGLGQAVLPQLPQA